MSEQTPSWLKNATLATPAVETQPVVRKSDAARIETPRALSEFELEARSAMSQPRADLFTILMLVKPERWMKGLWGNVKGGWNNARDNDRILTFDEARVLIADRIKELGLDAAKVMAYPHRHVGSVADYMAFLNAPFDQQMSKFKEPRQ